MERTKRNTWLPKIILYIKYFITIKPKLSLHIKTTYAPVYTLIIIISKIF